MYSFLVARIIPPKKYEWFVYHSRKPVELMFRNKPVTIEKGMRFGVRPSASKKDIRLIFPNDPNRVITLTLEQAEKLAEGVKVGGK